MSKQLKMITDTIANRDGYAEMLVPMALIELIEVLTKMETMIGKMLELVEHGGQ